MASDGVVFASPNYSFQVYGRCTPVAQSPLGSSFIYRKFLSALGLKSPAPDSAMTPHLAEGRISRPGADVNVARLSRPGC
jgi:hypothetical protein